MNPISLSLFIMNVQLVILGTILAYTSATYVEEFSTANNLFAADIYKEQIQLNNGNVLLSPFSASVVLALTQSGAEDDTANELRAVLHLPDDEATKTAIQTYHELLSESKSISSANRIYVKDSLDLKSEFQQTATDFFATGVENIDFSQSEQAANTINEWVEGQTHNKIQDLVKASSLDDSTAAVLVNALYFKGTWKYKFDKSKTKKMDFYTTPSDVVEVDTMVDEGNTYYIFESKVLKATFLAMPLEECLCFFIIGLPDDKDGLGVLEQRAEEVFAKQDFVAEKVKVQLPKFTVKNDVNFTSILQKLGVSNLFSEEADLSGIAGEKGDLHVDEILQKAFVSVDENGVEAAASTNMQFRSASFDTSTPREFVADHPFVFYIWMNNLVLFAGRVLDPTQ